MKSAARKRVAIPVEQQIGRVVEAADADGRLEVELDGYACDARRAVSCLVEPMAGDTVLVVVHGDGIHVLAILERPRKDAPTRLACGPNVELEAAESISMSAPRVAIDGPEEAALRGHRVAVRATSLDVVASEAELLAHGAVCGAENVKTVAETVEVSAERSIERIGQGYRFVRDGEEVHADRIQYTAQQKVSLHGRHATVTAAELVKVDGGQIHLG
jgi:hypothetical protein